MASVPSYEGLLYLAIQSTIIIFRNSASCTHASGIFHALVAMTIYMIVRVKYLLPMSVESGKKNVREAPFPKLFLKNMITASKISAKSTSLKTVIRLALPPTMLNEIRGEGLFLIQVPISFTDTGIPDLTSLKRSVEDFKESLSYVRLSKTQGNRDIHHYGFQSADNCFTFWIDTSKKINYPSDRLVLSIINHRPFSSVECNWGIENEPRAIKSYVSYQHAKGFIDVKCPHLVKRGFVPMVVRYPN